MAGESGNQREILHTLVCDARETLDVAPPVSSLARTRWVPSDFSSLDATIDLETHIVQNGADVYIGASHSLADYLTDWRKALPFSEGELGVLVGVRERHPGVERLAHIVRQEVESSDVVDAGLVTAVLGKDLTQTWYRWRRGVGERFEGQRGIERASRALKLAQLAIEAGEYRRT